MKQTPDSAFPPRRQEDFETNGEGLQHEGVTKGKSTVRKKSRGDARDLNNSTAFREPGEGKNGERKKTSKERRQGKPLKITGKKKTAGKEGGDY